MMSAKWTWAAIGYMTVFGWCVGLLIYQLGGLITGEVPFGIFTVIAFALLPGLLYLLFRPCRENGRDVSLSSRSPANA